MDIENNRNTEMCILKAMLDFKPRNQNGIIRDMHRDTTKSTDRVQVHRAMNRIMGYFDRKVAGIDSNGDIKFASMDDKSLSYELTKKIWVLRKDLNNINNMLIEYNELLYTLQSNDMILDMIIDKHTNNMYTNEALSDDQIHDFKEKLSVSPTFFEFYVGSDAEDLKKTFDTLYSIEEHGIYLAKRNADVVFAITGTVGENKYSSNDLGFADLNPGFDDLVRVIFKACVQADVLTGKSYNRGVNYFKNINNNR